ncbi:MAG: helix-turn-helix domain-containing protein [bacterium]|nr:helix-turn-helix domain-containing protein [bacterium]
MNKEVSKFGQKVRKVRLQKEMSQGDIARVLGVHRTYISGLERGVRNPSLLTIQEVAKLVENKETTEIVNQTLAALKNTTDAVVAVSSQKPELADQVADLAAAEEQALSDVVPQAEGEVKQAVEDALTVSRESLGKLKNPEGDTEPEPEVKGTISTTPTSTTVGVKKPNTKPQTATITPPEGLIQSPIQINDVIDAITGDSLPPLEP